MANRFGVSTWGSKAPKEVKKQSREEKRIRKMLNMQLDLQAKGILLLHSLNILTLYSQELFASLLKQTYNAIIPM